MNTNTNTSFASGTHSAYDQDALTEIALSICERVAALSNARAPITPDEPLMLAGLNPASVVQLHAWLQAQYDWDDEKRLLFDEEITAEGLARDIVPVTASLPGDADTSVSADAREDASPEGALPAIRIEVHDEMRRHGRDSAPRSVPESASQYLAAEAVLDDIGMAPYESWTGSGKRSKRGGMIFGLIALGLLGSPLPSSSPSLPSSLPCQSPRPPSLFPLIGAPAHVHNPVFSPSVAHTPLFSPWLAAVRFHGMEPMQSPWVPTIPQARSRTKTRRGSHGLGAFPKSPRGFRC
ncbi:hypothetical protein WOLCODRAFT_28913 [Wolfiporia cocos MD-104 SS10]|uniref:Uncharacterized protein n=1 Tax=Wolfiporia cocos (strain MD-104) TaxID=742152 RepID=A0A2H3JH93_WOLCO|nr:hypothetical protein WOLCODRAFT_28913 [Wolfiporia cocos MD-104 SS10]